MVGCSKTFTPQSKYSSHWWGFLSRLLQSSSQSCGFLMSVFFPSMEKIESTDATGSTGEEFSVNGTPVEETPSVVTGTPFDFAPLWKLIPLPPTPVLSLHISQPCYDQPSFTAQNGALFRGQPTRCLLIQGFLFFVFNPVWTFSKGDARASKRLCLCLCQRSQRAFHRKIMPNFTISSTNKKWVHHERT